MSLPSDPEPVKKTRLNCGGVRSDEPLRELDGRRVGGLEEAVVVRQLEHLPVGRIREFAPPVADVDAPQAGHAVEDAVAVGVVEVDALGPDDDPRALRLQRLVVGERVQVMLAVELLPGGGGPGWGWWWASDK